MRDRKHHNNDGRRQIKNGKTRTDAMTLAEKLDVPYGTRNLDDLPDEIIFQLRGPEIREAAVRWRSLLLDARAERDAYERAAIRALQRTERAEALAGEYERDARRYRWLRAQQWNGANMFVVCGGKSVIKLGVDCPNLDRLDTAIDAIGGRVEEK